MIAGCSNDEVEAENNGTYKETIALEDEFTGTSGILLFSPYWEHTVNGFTNKISRIAFMQKSGSKESKALVSIKVIKMYIIV